MRRKLYVALIVVMIIFSVTTISAQTDIKGSLKNWYEEKFQQKSAQHSAEIASKITSLENDIHTLLDRTSHDIDTALADFVDSSTAMSEEEIFSHQEHYQKQLEAIKKDLLLELEVDGEEFLEEEKEKIESDMKNSVIDTLNDILNQK